MLAFSSILRTWKWTTATGPTSLGCEPGAFGARAEYESGDDVSQGAPRRRATTGTASPLAGFTQRDGDDGAELRTASNGCERWVVRQGARRDRDGMFRSRRGVRKERSKSARRKVRAGKCAPESARRKVRALDRPNRATYNRSPGSRVPMFTSTHGPRGREPLRPDAPSATGESSVTRLSRFTDVPRLTLHFMRDMMLPTLCYDSQSILGFSPRTREACVDAAGSMSAADATGNRSERYRTAGIGRGGYAP